MSDSKEKRYIGDTGYEVKHSLWLGGKEILLAENMQAKDGQYYLIAQYVEKGFLCEYSRAAISDDYLEILRTFTERINKEVMAIQAERDITNYPPGLFTAEHCYPHSYDQSIAGKVVIIKPSVLSPEYRYGDNTLVYATHGNGTAANARGSAVFCYHLNTGKHTRFERQDVMGIIRPEYMPDWA